jgi:hypothetical protein
MLILLYTVIKSGSSFHTGSIVKKNKILLTLRMKLCELHALMQFKEVVLNGIKLLTVSARVELQESDCELT